MVTVMGEPAAIVCPGRRAKLIFQRAPDSGALDPDKGKLEEGRCGGQIESITDHQKAEPREAILRKPKVTRLEKIAGCRCCRIETVFLAEKRDETAIASCRICGRTNAGRVLMS